VVAPLTSAVCEEQRTPIFVPVFCGDKCVVFEPQTPRANKRTGQVTHAVHDENVDAQVHGHGHTTRQGAGPNVDVRVSA
jgi:hypothetical protein